MKKEIIINVNSDTNYEDIKRKVGMKLFDIEKTEKMNTFDKIVITIEVSR